MPKILTNYDLKKNQLLNVRIQNLSSAPSNPVEGLIYYNTTDYSFYIYQNSAWVNHTTLTASRISDFNDAVKAIKLNEMAAPTASVSMNGQKLTNLADGSAATDAVTKGQLDTLAATVTSPMNFKGGFDASEGDFIALNNIVKGDMYKITVAGVIDGIDFNIGDSVFAIANVTGTPVAADLLKIDNTEAPDIVRLDGVQTLTNKTINADNNTIANLEVDNFKSGAIVTTLAGDSDTTLPTTKTVKAAIDLAVSGSNSGISDLQAALSTETTNRTNADNTLQGHIDDVVADLAQELLDRAAADTAIQGELDATQTGAGLGANGAYAADGTTNYLTAATSLKDADKKLDAALKSGLDTAATNLSSAVTDLNTDIASVQSELDDTQLGAGLDADGAYTPFNNSNYIDSAISLKNADFILDTKVKVNADAIAAEIVARGNAVSAVAGDLATETTNRTSADNTLQININTVASNLATENTNRTNADTALQESIDDVVADLATEVTNRTNADATEVTNRNTAITNAIGVLVSDLASTASTKGAKTIGINDGDGKITATNVEDAVIELKDAITSEISTRQLADNTMQEQIDNLVAKDVLQDAVDAAESVARIAADGVLQTNINSEATARGAADTALAARITYLENNGGQEVTDTHTREVASANGVFAAKLDVDTFISLETRLLEIETVVDAKSKALTDEIADRAIDEAALQTNIDAEASTRASAISTVQGNLNTEITNRTNADNALQGNIDTEAATRLANDNTLQGNITAETNARIAAVSDLETAIGDEETRALAAEAALDTRVDALEAKVTKYAVNVGDGSAISIDVVHNLNTKDVVVMLYEVATGDMCITDINVATVNKVVVSFGEAPTTNEYRVVVIAA